LRLIGKLAVGQTPSAAETADSLLALNQMLTRWEANGIRLGFSPMASAGSVIPVPDEALEAITYNLAARLAPEFGYPTAMETAAMAEEGLRALQRDAIPTPIIDTELPRARRREINSGGWQ